MYAAFFFPGDIFHAFYWMTLSCSNLSSALWTQCLHTMLFIFFLKSFLLFLQSYSLAVFRKSPAFYFFFLVHWSLLLLHTSTRFPLSCKVLLTQESVISVNSYIWKSDIKLYLKKVPGIVDVSNFFFKKESWLSQKIFCVSLFIPCIIMYRSSVTKKANKSLPTSLYECSLWDLGCLGAVLTWLVSACRIRKNWSPSFGLQVDHIWCGRAKAQFWL